MRSSVVLTSLLVGSSVGGVLQARDATITPAVFARASCNKDNCYNVLANTPVVASPFCSTYIQSTSVVTYTPTVQTYNGQTFSPGPLITSSLPSASQTVPTHISSQCVLATSPPLAPRLSSACSCMSIIPSTVTSTSIAAATTVAATADPATCVGIAKPYYSTNGNVYNVDCSHTYNPLSSYQQYATTFLDCFTKCNESPQCVGFAWGSDDLTGCTTQSSVCALLDTDAANPVKLINADDRYINFVSALLVNPPI